MFDSQNNQKAFGYQTPTQLLSKEAKMSTLHAQGKNLGTQPDAEIEEKLT